METARNPQGLIRALAKASARRIPVVAIKVGRTELAAKLTVSHTGAIAGRDATYQALFDRYGVQRVDDLEQFATALLMDDVEDVDAFLEELYVVCAAQNIPAGATLKEFSPGQFEVNLHHVPQPELACDHAVLLKRAVKAVAKRHRLSASFMAATAPGVRCPQTSGNTRSTRGSDPRSRGR